MYLPTSRAVISNRSIVEFEFEALALTDIFVLMAVAIVVSGGLMIWLADHVAEFLKKNRMMEVLGLFILLIVGIMLLMGRFPGWTEFSPPGAGSKPDEQRNSRH